MTEIAGHIRQEIVERLNQIEVEEDVKVFFACESGSRAWGFPSSNSDYDVRFLYVRPVDWYLSIDFEHKRDVIERPINDALDISGWDLRKALQLFRKSNPPLLEWLQSPIVYREVGPVAVRFRDLIPSFYSPRAAHYHYLHMAQRNFHAYLRGELVSTKKYFYVLRPILAIKWIEADMGPVPTEFEVLVERLNDSRLLKEAIEKLLAEKRAGNELDRGPRIEPISAFIESELDRLDAAHPEVISPGSDIEALNDFFRASLKDLWSQEHT